MPKAFQELSRRQKNRRLCAYAREDSTGTSENKNSDTINAIEECNSTKSYEELSVVHDDETIYDVNDYNVLLPEKEWNTIDEEDEITYTQEEFLQKKLSLLNELANWAITHKLTLTSVTNLLKILKSHGMTELPKDARTLLQTPTETTITKMGEGQFWYNGIKSNLLSALSNGEVQRPMTKSLIFNIDGMSSFNSSVLQFWPIVFIIDEMPYLRPMVAAIYYGESKPPLQLFFEQFVEELKDVCSNGLIINGHRVNIIIKCFVCDTPARSFIKGTLLLNVLPPTL